MSEQLQWVTIGHTSHGCAACYTALSLGMRALYDSTAGPEEPAFYCAKCAEEYFDEVDPQAPTLERDRA